jgi:hypothetical protein
MEHRYLVYLALGRVIEFCGLGLFTVEEKTWQGRGSYRSRETAGRRRLMILQNAATSNAAKQLRDRIDGFSRVISVSRIQLDLLLRTPIITRPTVSALETIIINSGRVNDDVRQH